MIEGSNFINGNEEKKEPALLFPRGSKKIPLFLEFLLTITRLLVILVSILVVVLSIIAKASLLDIAIRVCLCIFILGLIGYFINWLIGRQYLASALEEIKEKNRNNQEDLNNTVQFEA